MAYLAEERVYYEGPDGPATTSYGFFLSHGEWDMPVMPFASEEDRAYAATEPEAWGLSPSDALRVGALVSAWGETDNESYLHAAWDIAGSVLDETPATWDTYITTVQTSIWE